jgi:hypothetical protein
VDEEALVKKGIETAAPFQCKNCRIKAERNQQLAAAQPAPVRNGGTNPGTILGFT